MNWPKTLLTERLHIRYPIIQAPMAGGPSTPQLVAAVANAGGLGSLAAGYLEPEQIRATIAETRNLTDQPFAVNFFVPGAAREDAKQIEHANSLLAPYRNELKLPANTPTAPWLPNFNEQLMAAMEAKVAIISFTFGVPPAEDLAALKEAGIFTMGTATHVLEAILLEESDIDMVIAQGAEAGGHRGTFLGSYEQGLVGTMVLIPLMVDHLRIPVVAAGGIMDGRGIVAALALGAVGVQMGSAFLACPESGAHRQYKQMLHEGNEINTVLTRVFSGKPARGVNNRFMDELRAHEAELPGYPIQNALTRDIRQGAAQQDRPEFMSLWAGQGCDMCRDKPAEELLAEWVAQVEAIRRTL